MKKRPFKLICLLLALVCAGVFASACAVDEPEEEFVDTFGDWLTVDQIMTILTDNPKAADDGSLKNYSDATLEKYVSPMWDSQIIYNESAVPVANEDGTLSPLKMSYRAARILDVKKSVDLNGKSFLYTEGKDYTLDADGRLVVPEDSRIDVMRFDEYYPDVTDGYDQWFYKHSDDHVTGIINSWSQVKPYELSVTYIRTQAFEGDKPTSRLDELGAIEDKIKSGTLNILFMGDSITDGTGPSNSENPKVPPYCHMVSQAIGHYTGREVKELPATGTPAAPDAGKVNYYNAGVGAIDLYGYNLMLDNKPEQIPDSYAKGRATQKAPGMFSMLEKADLIFMAFGANDGGGWANASGNGNDPATFNSRLKSVITKTRAKNPTASIVLVSSLKTLEGVYTAKTCLKTTAVYGSNLALYEAELDKLTKEFDNMAVAPVWSVQTALMSEGRLLRDFIADGRNHPNDFMSRIYAQTVLTTILPTGTLKTFPVRSK
jgi:lysophospholipase L1-like esterase